MRCPSVRRGSNVPRGVTGRPLTPGDGTLAVPAAPRSVTRSRGAGDPTRGGRLDVGLVGGLVVSSAAVVGAGDHSDEAVWAAECLARHGTESAWRQRGRRVGRKTALSASTVCAADAVR